MGMDSKAADSLPQGQWRSSLLPRSSTPLPTAAISSPTKRPTLTSKVFKPIGSPLTKTNNTEGKARSSGSVLRKRSSLSVIANRKKEKVLPSSIASPAKVRAKTESRKDIVRSAQESCRISEFGTVEQANSLTRRNEAARHQHTRTDNASSPGIGSQVRKSETLSLRLNQASKLPRSRAGSSAPNGSMTRERADPEAKGVLTLPLTDFRQPARGSFRHSLSVMDASTENIVNRTMHNTLPDRIPISSVAMSSSNSNFCSTTRARRGSLMQQTSRVLQPNGSQQRRISLMTLPTNSQIGYARLAAQKNDRRLPSGEVASRSEVNHFDDVGDSSTASSLPLSHLDISQETVLLESPLWQGSDVDVKETRKSDVNQIAKGRVSRSSKITNLIREGDKECVDHLRQEFAAASLRIAELEKEAIEREVGHQQEMDQEKSHSTAIKAALEEAKRDLYHLQDCRTANIGLIGMLLESIREEWSGMAATATIELESLQSQTDVCHHFLTELDSLAQAVSSSRVSA